MKEINGISSIEDYYEVEGIMGTWQDFRIKNTARRIYENINSYLQDEDLLRSHLEKRNNGAFLGYERNCAMDVAYQLTNDNNEEKSIKEAVLLKDTYSHNTVSILDKIELNTQRNVLNNKENEKLEINDLVENEYKTKADNNEKHRFLTDIMTEKEYEFISELNGIIKFITAGTGAGKTHWLINKFCKDNAKDSNVLILCNRSALKDQTLLEFSKANNSLEMALIELGFKDISHDIVRRMEYGNVDIKTYHSLSNISMEELERYDHIICDECHFLLQDSIFNEKCEEITEKLFDLMEGKGRNLIMITATEFEILKLLELQGYSEDDKNLKLFDYNKVINSFDRIDFVCCTKKIEDLMKIIPDDEKCLLFTKKSKNYIKGLSNKFSDSDYIHSRWISDKINGTLSSDKEMSEKHKKIIENSKFDSKYLIANSSIDNGISFHDEKLRTIIIDNIFDIVQIIQMIGRKRFNFNSIDDRLTVFLVSNSDNAKKELEFLTEVCNMVIHYNDNLKDSDQTTEKKIEFDNKWGHLIGDENGILPNKKKAKQIAVYRKVVKYEEAFYIRKYTAMKSIINKDFLDDILSMPIEILNMKLPESMKAVKGINLKIAMAISEKYGKSIDEIEVDNGRRNTILKKKAEIKHNLEFELEKYLEEISNKEYLFGEEKKEFIRTMQVKFGAGDSEEHHAILRIGSINKVINEVGYNIKSKQKKINQKTETVWIVKKIK